MITKNRRVICITVDRLSGERLADFLYRVRDLTDSIDDNICNLDETWRDEGGDNSVQLHGPFLAHKEGSAAGMHIKRFANSVLV